MKHFYEMKVHVVYCTKYKALFLYNITVAATTILKWANTLLKMIATSKKKNYRASTVAETPPHRDRTGSYLNGSIPPIPPKRMPSFLLCSRSRSTIHITVISLRDRVIE